MRLQLTERQAWLLIAHRLLESNNDDAGYGSWGVCFMIDDLKDELRISPELAEKMEDRLIAWFRPRNFVGYFWSRDTAGDAHRGWAALFLAEMTGEDD